jgi:uncharacterized protein YeaO (DUF488 family)
MRKILKTGAAALMLTSMLSDICAAAERSAGCANAADLYAVRAAAIQQNLMVAALSCHAIPQYNQFVMRYRPELQASDHQLEALFRRLYGPAGTARYHAFKTHLANASSLQSVNKGLTYCADAQASFDLALSRGRMSLTAFIAAEPSRAEEDFAPCAVVTASTKRAG